MPQLMMDTDITTAAGETIRQTDGTRVPVNEAYLPNDLLSQAEEQRIPQEVLRTTPR